MPSRNTFALSSHIVYTHFIGLLPHLTVPWFLGASGPEGLEPKYHSFIHALITVLA
jgi:hypothetical protein